MKKVCLILLVSSIIIVLTTIVAHQFDSLWPQPNAEDWGRGRILITSSFPSVREKHTHNKCAELYECPKMYEDDAVALLHKVSGVVGEGSKKLVNETYVDKNPLDIAR